jgi:hypothetical protein
MKEQLIKLPTATRHGGKPCCLQHYGIDRGARKINCDAYVEAMLLYMPSRPYERYFPTTKKSNQIHHMLLQHFKEVEGEDNGDTLEVLLPPQPA